VKKWSDEVLEDVDLDEELPDEDFVKDLENWSKESEEST